VEAKRHIRTAPPVILANYRWRLDIAVANGRKNWIGSVTGNILVRLVLYYAVLIALMVAAWRFVPHTELIARASLDALFGSTLADAVTGSRTRVTAPGSLNQTTLAVTVGLAMVSSVLLALPVAWVYIRTRAKRGYQQSVVQTLIILPVVVAGIVVLVKYSVALAFSLAGIVAAVRFRNTLDDSKDAVYVFLATAVGLAAAVDLPVAFVVSFLFNVVVLALWYTDFGRTPAHLDGAMAERKLQRAMEQLSRTGTFVARIDEQVFQDMSAEQLSAVADRAWRRARRHNKEAPDPEGRHDSLLRVRTYDIQRSRSTIEPLLEEHLKRWRYGGVVHETDGTHVVEYVVALKKSQRSKDVLEMLQANGSPHVIGAELN
jgi:hypothetical protein